MEIWLKQIIVLEKMKLLKFVIKNVLYATKEIVFMLLDNVIISVFASNVIKVKVILIYWNVLFVALNFTIENVHFFPI